MDCVCYELSNEKMIVNGRLRKKSKETVMAYFKALPVMTGQ